MSFVISTTLALAPCPTSLHPFLTFPETLGSGFSINPQQTAKRPGVDHLSDNEVMMRVKDGELDQLGLLFERYHMLVFTSFVNQTSNRAVSEDLTQDVFLRILKYRRTFRPGNEFKTWMYTIARNVLFSFFRKHKREMIMDDPDSLRDDEFNESEATPDAELARAGDTAMLRQALEKLSIEKRQLLVLRRLQGVDYDEIAQLLDCPIKPLKVRVHRAFQELKEVFQSLAKETTI